MIEKISKKLRVHLLYKIKMQITKHIKQIKGINKPNKENFDFFNSLYYTYYEKDYSKNRLISIIMWSTDEMKKWVLYSEHLENKLKKIEKQNQKLIEYVCRLSNKGVDIK